MRAATLVLALAAGLIAAAQGRQLQQFSLSINAGHGGGTVNVQAGHRGAGASVVASGNKGGVDVNAQASKGGGGASLNAQASKGGAILNAQASKDRRLQQEAGMGRQLKQFLLNIGASKGGFNLVANHGDGDGGLRVAATGPSFNLAARGGHGNKAFNLNANHGSFNLAASGGGGGGGGGDNGSGGRRLQQAAGRALAQHTGSVTVKVSHSKDAGAAPAKTQAAPAPAAAPAAPVPAPAAAKTAQQAGGSKVVTIDHSNPIKITGQHNGNSGSISIAGAGKSGSLSWNIDKDGNIVINGVGSDGSQGTININGTGVHNHKGGAITVAHTPAAAGQKGSVTATATHGSAAKTFSVAGSSAATAGPSKP